MDPESVIWLGHTRNVPLMCLASELSYGFEPHGHIGQPDWLPRCIGVGDVGHGRCTRGVAAGWYREGVYRVLPTRRV